MRRSSVIILSIMLVAFGAMFAAAGSALRPLAQDAEASKVLTRHMLARGDVEAGTRVRLSRLPGSEKRLANEGRGLVIQLVPAARVRARRGGLRLLALRVAREGLSRFPGKRVDWIEVDLEVPRPGGGAPQQLKTLMDTADGSSVGEPAPPLPVVFPPRAPKG